MNKIELLEQLLLPVFDKIQAYDRNKPVVVKIPPHTEEWLQVMWLRDRYGLKSTAIVKMCIRRGFQELAQEVVNGARK